MTVRRGCRSAYSHCERLLVYSSLDVDNWLIAGTLRECNIYTGSSTCNYVEHNRPTTGIPSLYLQLAASVSAVIVYREDYRSTRTQITHIPYCIIAVSVGYCSYVRSVRYSFSRTLSELECTGADLWFEVKTRESSNCKNRPIEKKSSFVRTGYK